MLNRIWRMLIKEFIQLFRDPRMKAILFIVPVVQVLLFGYAVNTDVRHIKLSIIDQDNTAESRNLSQAFIKSGYFDPLYPLTFAEATRLMDKGETDAILHVSHGFSATLTAQKINTPAVIEFIVDGTDSARAGTVLNYSSRIVGNLTSQQISDTLAKKLGGNVALPGVHLETRAWFNENLESRNFFIPGVIAVIVMLITLMLTSMSIVRESEMGTIEQIMVTPIRPFEFIIGKALPFVFVAFLNVTVIALVGVLWFGVPIRGSIPLLFLATLLFLMTSLGIGLFISTISTTQQQAVITTFFFFNPAMQLSGFIFPVANMPEVIQWLTYLNPLRYYLVIIRGIFLKGVGMEILQPEMWSLFVMGVVVLGLSSLRFHKRAG